MSKCLVENCERTIRANGYCERHYKNYKRTGNPLGATKRLTRGVATRHPLYRMWAGMRQRCMNPTSRSYSDYGGRGIKICERWDEFWDFVDDMGPRPSQIHSLDRTDVNGNYEPANVKWATSLEQSWNRRSTQLTEEDRKNILRLKLEGKNSSEISRELGTEYEATLRFVNKQSYVPDTRNYSEISPAKTITEEELEFKPVRPEICKADNCEELVYAHGHCRKHYRRKTESKSLEGVVDITAARFCKNCEKQLSDEARPDSLYCTLSCKMKWHRREGCYTQDEHKKRCSVEGCNRPMQAKKMCRSHYMEQWHAENPRVKPPDQ